MSLRLLGALLLLATIVAPTIQPAPASAVGVGALHAWGNNDTLQLNEPNNVQIKPYANAVAPAYFPSGCFFMKEVAAGAGHSLALTTAGEVCAWGRNSSGELGDGGFNSPRGVDWVTGLQGSGKLSSATSISAGYQHSLALLSDGSVWTWGKNDLGQLGDGGNSNRPSPAPVSGLEDIIAIDGGGAHNLALKVDGTVWAWGDNGHGQLGDGTTTLRPRPVQVKGPGRSGFLQRIIAISAGGGHSLALRDDGTVLAWGLNADGQVGDGTGQDRHLPVQVQNLVDVTSISAGSSHSLARQVNGWIWAWGANNFGQLGEGNNSPESVPVQVSYGNKLISTGKAVAAGGFHSLVLLGGGTLLGFGLNVHGQVGDGTTDPALTSKDVMVGPVNPPSLLSGVALIAAGGSHSLAIRAGTMVRATGANPYGQLGDDSNQDRQHLVLAEYGNHLADGVAAGDEHSLIAETRGVAIVWGRNDHGQLGDDSKSDADEPKDLLGISDQVVAVKGGGAHSLALTVGSGVYAWGANDGGQLGDGSTDERLEPIRVHGSGRTDFLGRVKAIAAGSEHSLALLADGTVVAWGRGGSGQLGDGGAADQDEPVAVVLPSQSDAPRVKAIAAGADHSLALTSDGRVLAWGANADGQLGDGSVDDSSTPVQVKHAQGPGGLLRRIKAIAGGSLHSLAIRSSGHVLSWGDGQSGQIGDGAKADRPTAVLVKGSPGRGNFGDAIAIAGGGQHSLALSSGGVVFGWGANGSGQLGDDSQTDRASPVKMLNDFENVNSLAVDIAAGSRHSVVLDRRLPFATR